MKINLIKILMKINGKISSRNKMYNLNQNNRRLNNLRFLVKDQILLSLIDGLDLMIICNVGMSYVCLMYVLRLCTQIYIYDVIALIVMILSYI